MGSQVTLVMGEEMQNIREILLNLRANIDPTEFKQERWVTEEEGTLISELIKLHGSKSYVESGTANGFSAMWAALGLPREGQVYTFDLHDRPKLWGDRFGCAALKSKINFTQADFTEVAKHLSNIQHPVTFFIDGDHGTTAVRRDWNAIQPLLQEGDLVLFHDYNMTQVQRVYAEIAYSPEAKGSDFYYFKTKRQIAGLLYKAVNHQLKDFETPFRERE